MDVKIFDPRFELLVDPHQELQPLLTGFKFVEGPIWHPQERSLIFSDILGNSLFRWTAEGGVTVIRRNSYMANGNTYDPQGRVITCEHATSRVTRTDFSASDELEVLASHYQGKQLNSPNDVTCTKAGLIYFTDPAYGRGAGYGVPRPQELPFQGVFRLDPAERSLTLLADDFAKPNGICLSRDESQLFVNDSAYNHIRVFDLKSDGTAQNGKLWAELSPAGKGVSDGMKVDQAGNIYCTGPGGIHLYSPEACYLGIINMPEQTANLTWGDDDLCSLYVTATSTVYRLRTQIAGHLKFEIGRA